MEAEASPVEPHVEVAVTIEVIRAQKDVQVANSMDDDEDEEEHRRAGQADTVVAEGHVLLWHDGEEDLLHEAKHHVGHSTEPATELALALHAHLPVLVCLGPIQSL